MFLLFHILLGHAQLAVKSDITQRDMYSLSLNTTWHRRYITSFNPLYCLSEPAVHQLTMLLLLTCAAFAPIHYCGPSVLPNAAWCPASRLPGVGLSSWPPVPGVVALLLPPRPPAAVETSADTKCTIWLFRLMVKVNLLTTSARNEACSMLS